MITTDDLILINYGLSKCNLIHEYFPTKWKIILNSTIILGLFFSLIMFYFILNERYLLAGVFGILSLLSGIYFVKFKTGKEKIIIEEKYPYAVNLLNLRNQIIEIQKAEFKRIFKNNNNIYKKENLLFLIDCIRKENESKDFKYPITVNLFIIIIGSLFFGSFLGGFVNFADSNFNDYLSFYKIVFALIICILIIVFFIEKTIIKDVIDTQIKNRNNLIRTLENIYIERHIIN